MGQILVRHLDDAVIARLKRRAAAESMSLEQLARDVLAAAALPDRVALVDEIDALAREIGPVGGNSVDLIREDRDNAGPYR